MLRITELGVEGLGLMLKPLTSWPRSRTLVLKLRTAGNTAASPGGRLGVQTLGPCPDRLNQEFWEWGPVPCVETSLPGDSEHMFGNYGSSVSPRPTACKSYKVCHLG